MNPFNFTTETKRTKPKKKATPTGMIVWANGKHLSRENINGHRLKYLPLSYFLFLLLVWDGWKFSKANSHSISIILKLVVSCSTLNQYIGKMSFVHKLFICKYSLICFKHIEHNRGNCNSIIEYSSFEWLVFLIFTLNNQLVWIDL